MTRLLNIMLSVVVLIEVDGSQCCVSRVQQSDSVIHAFILSHILFYYGFLQGAEYSFLCYTVGPCS